MGETPNWQIPTPDGVMPVCEGAEQIEAMGQRIADIVTSWEADWARASRPPAAKVSFTAPAGQPQVLSAAGTNRPYFNTVELDTAGMVDLGRWADRISFPIAGEYIIGAQITGTIEVDLTIDTTVLSYIFSGGFALNPIYYSFTCKEHGSGSDVVIVQGLVRVKQQQLDNGYLNLTPRPPTLPYAQTSILGGANVSVTYADLWAFLVSDEINQF